VAVVEGVVGATVVLASVPAHWRRKDDEGFCAA
jgi:hypothetical protein